MIAKRAVIVVGSHHVGKSKTINRYLKPRLGIRETQHRFSLGERIGTVLSQSREEAATQRGIVLSQSFEEAGRCEYIADFVLKYAHFELLVLAARPSDENPSCLLALKAKLWDAGYKVRDILLVGGQAESYYRGAAETILMHLRIK